MNVGELKRALEEIDNNLDIVILKDSRGQRCEKIGSEISIGVFDEDRRDFTELECWNIQDQPLPNAIRIDA